MYNEYLNHLHKEISDIKEAGLYKNERILTTAQGPQIQIVAGLDVLNFCANNYLGLSNNEHIVDAARKALVSYGYGMSSVRFICGTSDLHKELENKISSFSEHRILSYMHPVLMLMEGYLSRYLEQRMQLFLIV